MPSGLLAAAVAVREARMAALRAEVAAWRGAIMCSECFKPVGKHQHAGRPRLRCGSDACRKAWLRRVRYGWRKPDGHKAFRAAAITAARIEFRVATLAAAEARRKLKALVARGREIPNEG